jgi:Heparinase II/III-like protein
VQMSPKPARLLAKVREFGADSDIRAYLAYVSARPHLWRLRRPDLTSRQPEYLTNVVSESTRFSPPSPAKWGSRRMEPREDDLRLAGATLSAVSLEALPWNCHFEDIEDEASLHRFSWMLPWMADCLERGFSAASVWKRVETAIANWIDAHPQVTETEAWQSYTLSERIANWILGAIAAGSMPLSDRIVGSVVSQAEHLKQHLEYYGPRLTGNHLSNNGRALYAAGIVSGHSDLAAAGRDILIQEEKRLFSESGFLREGSSHYQFLVTRNFDEILFLARASGDESFERALTARVQRMRDACAFFLVRGGQQCRLPLIGDISPDCSPEWLLGIASDTPSGWRSLFPEAGGRGNRSPDSEEWSRLDVGEWLVFAHVNPTGFPLTPGHAHHDTGSLSIFWQGEPVVLDCGRYHYVNDAVGRFGQNAGSHSILTVDGLNPEPRAYWFLSDEYVRNRSGGSPMLSADATAIRISHRGYERSPGVGLHSRDIVIDGEVLTVSDLVEGKGWHRVSLIFHLPNAKVHDRSIEVRAGDRMMTLDLPSDLVDRKLITSSAQQTYGWTCPRYGDRVPITTVVAEARVRFPWRGTSILRIHR